MTAVGAKATGLRADVEALAGMTRDSAGAGERASAEWAAGRLRELGAEDVRVERLPLPADLRVRAGRSLRRRHARGAPRAAAARRGHAGVVRARLQRPGAVVAFPASGR